MKLLMLRLSGLSADAESSLHVPSFFDEVIAQGADAGAGGKDCEGRGVPHRPA
jgi:hypothetical protein